MAALAAGDRHLADDGLRGVGREARVISGAADGERAAGKDGTGGCEDATAIHDCSFHSVAVHVTGAG